MEVPYHYDPRDYQAEFLEQIRERRMAVLKWARRAGKGLTTFAYAISRMVEEPMGVVIIYPTKEQGYNSFWNNVENDGFRTIEHVPKELISAQTNTVDNMSMVLKNGSTLTVLGANANPEAIRGQNTKLYILSEFVDIRPGVLGIIRPIVAANGGQIIIESTTKQDGISGETFLRLYSAAEKDPTQLAMKVTADRYMSAEQLEQVRQDYIDEYGNDFLYRQEFLLDEGQALATSYYGNLITKMKNAGQIGVHPYNPDYPVFTSWDLGSGKGTTAIVFWQYYDKAVHIIDGHETHSIGDEDIVKFLKTKPYVYGHHFWPHDGKRADSDAIARVDKVKTHGLDNVSILPRAKSKEDGIREVVAMFTSMATTVHEPLLLSFFNKLKKYKRKFNEITGDYEGPEHKTASHFADAVRYISDAIDNFFDPTTGAFLMDGSQDGTYESEDLVSGFYDDDLL